MLNKSKKRMGYPLTLKEQEYLVWRGGCRRSKPRFCNHHKSNNFHHSDKRISNHHESHHDDLLHEEMQTSDESFSANWINQTWFLWRCLVNLFIPYREECFDEFPGADIDDILKYEVPRSDVKPVIKCSGMVTAVGNSTPMKAVVAFDITKRQGNYISKEYLDRIALDSTQVVGLVEDRVCLNVSLEKNYGEVGKKILASFKVVSELEGCDVIIGLPDIVGVFNERFKECHYVTSIQEQESSVFGQSTLPSSLLTNVFEQEEMNEYWSANWINQILFLLRCLVNLFIPYREECLDEFPGADIDVILKYDLSELHVEVPRSKVKPVIKRSGMVEAVDNSTPMKAVVAFDVNKRQGSYISKEYLDRIALDGNQVDRVCLYVSLENNYGEIGEKILASFKVVSELEGCDVIIGLPDIVGVFNEGFKECHYVTSVQEQESSGSRQSTVPSLLTSYRTVWSELLLSKAPRIKLIRKFVAKVKKKKSVYLNQKRRVCSDSKHQKLWLKTQSGVDVYVSQSTRFGTVYADDRIEQLLEIMDSTLSADNRVENMLGIEQMLGLIDNSFSASNRVEKLSRNLKQLEILSEKIVTITSILDSFRGQVIVGNDPSISATDEDLDESIGDNISWEKVEDIFPVSAVGDNSNEFNIFIELSPGKIITQSVRYKCTVSCLMNSVQCRCGYIVGTLHYQGKPLFYENLTIEDYGIIPGTTLRLHQKLQGGSRKSTRLAVVESVVVKWLTSHEYVGRKVAKYFKVGKKRKLFNGKVTKYLPEKNLGKGDDSFFVVYEDEDEEEMDRNQFVKGEKCYLDFYACYIKNTSKQWGIVAGGTDIEMQVQSSTNYCSMRNGSNLCFLNTAFQVIVHSFNLFKREDDISAAREKMEHDLLDPSLMENARKAKELLDLLVLCHGFYTKNEIEYLHEVGMGTLLSYFELGTVENVQQQDVHEVVFAKITDIFEKYPSLFRKMCSITFCSKLKSQCKGILVPDREISIDEPELMLNVHSSLEDCIERYFEDETRGLTCHEACPIHRVSDEIEKSLNCPKDSPCACENKYCKETRYECCLAPSTVQKTVTEAPQVLQVLFKRFDNGRNKLDDKIEIKKKFEFVEGSTYIVTGGVIHKGSSSSNGHYYALFRNPNGSWTECDDLSIKVLDETHAMDLLKEAYMIFATKEDNKRPSENTKFKVRDVLSI